MVRLIAFVCSLFVCSLLNAQILDYSKHAVKTLSSEEYSGRGYTNKGIEKAASFIMGEFEKSNVRSLGNDYLQPFYIDVNTFPGDLKLTIDGQTFSAGTDFIIDPASPSTIGEFDIQYILQSELLKPNKLQKLISSSEGKFIIIDQREEIGLSKESKKKISEIVNFIKYNPQLKSMGTIVLTHKKLTWHIAPLQVSRPTFILNSGSELKKPGKVYVKADAQFQKDFKTGNIVGFHKGTVYPDSLLVLTAHYDHLGNMGKDVFIPGANDNASGVAMLLSLAKHFNEHLPTYSVAYICTGAEELGLLGAKHFVENPLFDLTKIKFLVNFDLAGTGDDGIKVVNGSVFQEEFDRLTEINSKNNLLPAVKIRGEACNSDHCMFYQKGVPSFYIYTLGGIKAYHDVNDKFETLPFTKFEDYHKLMVEFLEGF